MSENAAKILIVEDEQIVAVDIESTLQRLGYQVVGAASSGDDACRMAAALEPDLVLMDVRIDGRMDGIEAASQIRRAREIPVVFLTAYADLDTLGRAKLIGPCGYIVKPFAEHDLRATIYVALHKGEMDRRLRESHEDLRTILDAQRHATVLLDADGRIRFVSRAARKIGAAAGSELMGAPLSSLLPLSANQARALDDMSSRRQEDRDKVPLLLDAEGREPQHLEIEIIDDPRGDGGKFLFLYDQSPLVGLRRQLDEHSAFQNIIGKSQGMRRVFQLIEQLAKVDSTVLIEGETGTGKELVARAIHQLSGRRDGPFLALNCGGLSEELAASQLFGHRRGAFTGAVDDRQGLFEAAGGGTLFMDEIGELPLRVQTTLLRVLEENAVLPLGESKLHPVDIRVLAATHRNLAQEAVQSRFRQDLLYRIRVARISLPALRDRREDLPLLVRSFLAQHRASTGRQVDAISDEAMAVIVAHGWPGNVRELRNALEFAVIRASGSIVQPEDLPPELLECFPEVLPGQQSRDGTQRIKEALRWARGNRTKAATVLGISRATLYRRLRDLGIEDT